MSLFRSKKDIEFIKKINQELIEDVISEKVTYYAISDKFTEINFYGESKEKIYDPPVEIYALVEWLDQDIKTTEFGQDIIYNIKASVLYKHLNDINLEPVEGDMVEYEAIKFEIMKIDVADQIFGKAYNDIGLVLTCKSIRNNVFKVSVSGTVDQPKRTYPDNPLTSSFYYTDAKFPYSGSV